MIILSNEELENYFKILDVFFAKYEESDKELENLEKDHEKTEDTRSVRERIF